MKTILVLGGNGFIGSNVLNYIDNNLSDSYNVILFDKYETHPYGIKFNCTYKRYYGDFSDIKSIKTIFSENKIDIIFHFITTTAPATSSNIKYDIESNLIATIEFVNLMIKFNVKNIVYLSSGGSVYGNSSVKNSETSPTQPQSSYGIVKLAIEKYLMMFANKGKIKPLIVRLSNPYGPYHYSMKQGIINVALRSAIEKQKFSVWGNGENLKDYIYIEDFVQILFNLIEMKKHNEILNIGSGALSSSNTILSHVNRLYSNFRWTQSNLKLFDVTNFELDLSKLKKNINFFNFTPIKEGINKTNNWLINQQIKKI